MAILVEFCVQADEFPLGELFVTVPDVSVELERIVPVNDSLFPYVWIRGAERIDVEAAIGETDAATEFTLIDDLGKRGLLYRVDWNPDLDGIVSAIAESNASLLSATGKHERWTFKLRVDDHAELGAFQDRCRSHGVRITLVRLQPLEYTDEDERVTPAQLEALELAFQRGYFDDPRRATLDDLASELHITRQSLAGRLRRGHRNLLTGVFGDGGRALERAASSTDD
ncbi:helix-turn-helix domain-containing protein [Natrarchaeobius chitinivorans]|nr:helix-turn-helix domain-containing protein [Natrarchaeobius chitinivorans]